MLDLFADETFWVLISTVVCVAVLVKYGKQPLLNMLDGRTETIRERIERAEKLRADAQDLLAKYERKHRDAMKEADDIIAEAQVRAKKMQKKAEEQLNESIDRLEEQARQRIARAEEDAIADIKSRISDIAVAKATDILKKFGDKNTDTSDSIKRTVRAINGKTLH